MVNLMRRGSYEGGSGGKLSVRSVIAAVALSLSSFACTPAQTRPEIDTVSEVDDLRQQLLDSLGVLGIDETSVYVDCLRTDGKSLQQTNFDSIEHYVANELRGMGFVYAGDKDSGFTGKYVTERWGYLYVRALAPNGENKVFRFDPRMVITAAAIAEDGRLVCLSTFPKDPEFEPVVEVFLSSAAVDDFFEKKTDGGYL